MLLRRKVTIGAAMLYMMISLIMFLPVTAHAQSWTATHNGTGNRKMYKLLTAKEKKAYDAAIQAEDGKTKGPVALTEKEQNDVISALGTDYPEVYMRYVGSNIFKQTEDADRNIKFARALRTSGSIEKKARWAYYCIVGGCKYKDTDRDQYPVSVFKDQKSVCAGMSYAYQLLCNVNGIDCRYVRGISSAGNHAWNIIKYTDGKWYVVDTSYGSAYGRGDSAKEKNNRELGYLNSESGLTRRTTSINIPKVTKAYSKKLSEMQKQDNLTIYREAKQSFATVNGQLITFWEADYSGYIVVGSNRDGSCVKKTK